MKKLLLIGLVLLALTSCNLFQKNPFLGTWDADMSPFNPDLGDYWTIIFYDDETFREYGQIYSIGFANSGTYEYFETLLIMAYKGYPKDYLNYVIYDDVMVWNDFLYLYRR